MTRLKDASRETRVAYIDGRRTVGVLRIGGRFPMRGLRHLAEAPGVRSVLVPLLLLGCGVGLAALLPATDPTDAWFFFLASTLLAVGLFAATSGIPRLHRDDLGLVALAVTVGVLVKAVLIAGVMVLAFAEPAYLVLGAVMAQIDPLAVVALNRRSRLSVRGRAVLIAWSSFDDPVTSVLVLLVMAAVVRNRQGLTPEVAQPLTTSAVGLAENVALVAVAAAVWWGGQQVMRRRSDAGADGAAGAERPAFTLVASIALTGLLVWAVGRFLMFGIAVAGLFYRPRIEPLLARLVAIAFVAATVLLGMVAAEGVAWWPGVFLGLTTFAAQALVAVVVTRSLPRADRLRLVLGQQSGITAIILALLVEPVVAGTVAVVAPAVVVVNLLHLGTNAVLDRVEDRRAAASSGGSASSVGSSGRAAVDRDATDVGR